MDFTFYYLEIIGVTATLIYYYLYYEERDIWRLAKGKYLPSDFSRL
jgi:hypothetical protein